MKTNKTPYEIRSDLLRLAFDILRSQLDPNDNTQQREVNSEEVIKEAQRLNVFVSAGN